MKISNKDNKNIILLLIVASMGYFVDIYDLILFNIIKKDSLSSLGISVEKYETVLFRWQMAGMMIGGILWGIWGDVKGRVSVLFGSILLYSLANIANAFVTTVEAYKFWRLMAGIGLAGELGAAITLVSELMPTQKRGIGTMVIVTFGALGAVFAFTINENGDLISSWISSLIDKPVENWQTAYIVGGIMGLLLLALRASTFESGLFEEVKDKKDIQKGKFLWLFNKKNRTKYIACITIGLPVWFVIGILIALAHKFFPEIYHLTTGNSIQNKQLVNISTPEMVMWSYVGLSIGDIISGLMSQVLQSRKKAIYFNLAGILIFTWLFLFGPVPTNEDNGFVFGQNYYKIVAVLLGTVTGYWAVFVTNASEQFGTNIRSTVAATVPNFVRGGVLLITGGFEIIAQYFQHHSGIWNDKPYSFAAIIIGAVCLILGWWGTYQVEESFHKELDYYEVMDAKKEN